MDNPDAHHLHELPSVCLRQKEVLHDFLPWITRGMWVRQIFYNFLNVQRSCLLQDSFSSFFLFIFFQVQQRVAGKAYGGFGIQHWLEESEAKQITCVQYFNIIWSFRVLRCFKDWNAQPQHCENCTWPIAFAAFAELSLPKLLKS